mmetsp:Transcript_2780/g.8678  ORF Transcript_2780/g.8678 Transcript_2780/m.8678 type:complete len:209 (+) Transcript_2780:451-1077(+)
MEEGGARPVQDRRRDDARLRPRREVRARDHRRARRRHLHPGDWRPRRHHDPAALLAGQGRQYHPRRGRAGARREGAERRHRRRRRQGGQGLRNPVDGIRRRTAGQRRSSGPRGHPDHRVRVRGLERDRAALLCLQGHVWQEGRRDRTPARRPVAARAGAARGAHARPQGRDRGRPRVRVEKRVRRLKSAAGGGARQARALCRRLARHF